MTYEFVELVPDDMKEGVIYISTTYATVAHKCACGCGNEVITPLSPTDWKLTFDGESISLYPSIGNWNFDCRSHYWIKSNEIKWAYEWSDEEIKKGRFQDKQTKEEYYQGKKTVTEVELNMKEDIPEDIQVKEKTNFWSRIKNWFS